MRAARAPPAQPQSQTDRLVKERVPPCRSSARARPPLYLIGTESGCANDWMVSTGSFPYNHQRSKNMKNIPHIIEGRPMDKWTEMRACLWSVRRAAFGGGALDLSPSAVSKLLSRRRPTGVRLLNQTPAGWSPRRRAAPTSISASRSSRTSRRAEDSLTGFGHSPAGRHCASTVPGLRQTVSSCLDPGVPGALRRSRWNSNYSRTIDRSGRRERRSTAIPPGALKGHQSCRHQAGRPAGGSSPMPVRLSRPSRNPTTPSDHRRPQLPATLTHEGFNRWRFSDSSGTLSHQGKRQFRDRQCRGAPYPCPAGGESGGWPPSW